MPNVFIKNISNQTLTFTIDVEKNKVKDLMQMYADKTGVPLESVMFVYAGKPLREKQESLLKDVGIQNLSTVHAVRRLLGGAPISIMISTCDDESHKIQVDDDLTVYQLKEHIRNKLCVSLDAQTMALNFAGVELEDNKKLSSYKFLKSKETDGKIVQTKCSLGKIAGIILSYETDPLTLEQQTVRMACGHVIGRDGMTAFIRSLISAHRYKIQCPASKPNSEPCLFQWEFPICRKIGVFTAEEITQFEDGLSMNWINAQSSECPNCQSHVIKDSLESDRVICPKCKYGDYCFNCSKKWIAPGHKTCGHKDCPFLHDMITKAQWSTSFNMTMPDKSVKPIMAPCVRACPKCYTPINHAQGCKHMKCPCKTEFCFVCLNVKTNGEWACGYSGDYCGKVAPTQSMPTA